MYVAIGNSRLDHRERQLVALPNRLVKVALLCRVLPRSRIGSGEVRSVVGVTLRAGVDHHQLARFDDGGVPVIMEHFAVLGEYGFERDTPALGQSHAFHLAHDFLLHAPEADSAARHGVHLLSEHSGGVQLHDFLRLLDEPHGDDGAD